jgi:hypothetical protein
MIGPRPFLLHIWIEAVRWFPAWGVETRGGEVVAHSRDAKLFCP